MVPFRRPADMPIDSHSGYCSHNGTYYSKRTTMNNNSRQQTRPLTSDLTTYIFSYAYKLEEEEGGQRHFPSSQVQDALVDGNSGETITYSGLRQAVLVHKRQLHSLGVRKGSVVMIVSPNTFKLPPLFLAVFSLGAVLTLANPLSLQRDIQWQVALSKPTLIVATGGLLSSMHFTPPVIRLEDLLNNTLDNTWNAEECAVVSMDDAAAIMYSSGTTGKSKGVVLTHGNFASTVAGNMARHSSTSDGASKVCLLSIPLFFIYGLRFLLCSIAARATVVFHQSDSSNIGSLLHCIASHRVTLFPTLPHVLAKLLSSGFLDLTSLKQIAVGGAPLRKEIIHAFHHKFPSIQLTQAYGLTETTGGIIYTSGNEENRRIGTVGLLSDVVEAKIVDCISGQFLPPNHRGELWLRGPTIMKGYVDNEAETLLIMNSDGWLKTGDLCYIDEEGFLFIVDRLKDMIKYKGYQIAPAELEELLLSHPEIVEASVIPYPDQEEGQIPMAYVVKDSASNLDGEEVINFISKQVMPYKKLRHVVFLNSIPKNSNGKVLKRELVKRSYIQSRL